MIVQRDYQIQAVRGVWSEWFHHGRQSCLLQAPTGAGKGVMLSFLATKLLEHKQMHTLVMVHRREIVMQLAKHFRDAGVSCGTIMAGELYTPSRDIQVASVDTLDAWVRRDKIAAPDVGCIVVDECFPPETELLTERGFVRFDELKRGVKVAQENDGRLSFVEPCAYIKKPYTGDMMDIRLASGVQFSCTPNHHLVTYSAAGKERIESAQSTTLDGRRWMHSGASSDREGKKTLAPMEALLIATQADGSIHDKSSTTVAFSFTRPRKVERFLRLISEAGVTCNEVKAQARPSDSHMRRRFIVQFGRTVSKNLWDHFDLTTLTKEKADAILDEMIEWDGSRVSAKSGLVYYSSVVKSQADFCVAVAAIAGHGSTLTIQHDRRRESCNDVHRVFIRASHRRTCQNSTRTARPYAGAVHCVSVPSGKIVIRAGRGTLVVGNCHRAMGARYQRILDAYKERGAKLLGLTATPIRTDGVGLGRSFDSMVRTPDMGWMIDHGYLVPITYRVGIVPDLTGVKLTAGDYNQKQLDNVMQQRLLIGNVVDNWLHHAKGRPTMVFASGVAHSLALVDEFKAHGVKAAHIDAHTPLDVRDTIAQKLLMGTIEVACNAQVYVEGTDIPWVSCIVLAQPTKSIGKYLQMIGRGMRRYPGKASHLMVLDHAGAVHAHGRAEKDHDWVLTEGKDMQEKHAKALKKEKVQFVCPACGTLHTGAQCPTCNKFVEFTGAAKDFLPAMLVDMDQGSFDALMAPKPAAKKSKHEYSAQEKTDFYAQLLGHAKERGKKLGWVAHTYRDKFSVWPNRVEGVIPQPPGDEVRRFIQHKNMAFAKSRAGSLVK